MSCRVIIEGTAAPRRLSLPIPILYLPSSTRHFSKVAIVLPPLRCIFVFASFSFMLGASLGNAQVERDPVSSNQPRNVDIDESNDRKASNTSQLNAATKHRVTLPQTAATKTRRPNYGKIYRDEVRTHWTPNGNWMWYSVNGRDGQEYYKIDLHSGNRMPLFDAESLRIAISKQLNAPETDPTDLLEEVRVVDLTEQGNAWVRFRGITYELTETNSDEADGGLETRLEVVEDAVDDTQHFTLERRSRSGGREVDLKLVNATHAPFRCFWLSTTGEAIAYDTVASQSQFSQHTYENHLWSLRDDNGEELLRFRTPDFSCTIRVSESKIEAFQAYRRRAPERRSNRDRSTNRGGRTDARVITRDYNLWFRNEEGQLEPLTEDGTEQHRYRRPFISPSGRFAVAIEEDVAEKRTVTLVDSSPDDQLQPKVIELDYVKPGDAIDHPRLSLWNLDDLTNVSVSTDLFKNPWNLSRMQWLGDPERFLFLYNQRGHQRLRVLSLNPTNGKIDSVVDESSPTFIDYAHKTYMELIQDGKELLWASERSSYNHLYRYRVKDGKLLNAVTHGDWVLRDIVEIDEPSRTIWFSASGVVAGQNPYYRHLCRANLDGTDFRVLTEGDGDHRWEFSPDRSYLIDRYSRVDMATKTVLRSAEDGHEVSELATADWSDLVESEWSVPERFHTADRDGETEIHGIIVRPDHFDENEKYPIVEKIYAGPHSSHVPSSFGMLRQEHEIANEGFVVVRIDGMGTSNRGKKFHDVCWKNLADAGFPDRKIWIRKAAEEYPQMDLNRVGIFGGSAGGQNAMRALLDHHDLYQVAVADCGCHDNRMDKIWWNEAWMGWPVDQSYVDSSNVEHASRLQGKLLLIVGELDRNVDPASTMQVADALVKANKDFELLVLPGTGHGAAETPYGKRRRIEFLKRHLLGPRK